MEGEHVFGSLSARLDPLRSSQPPPGGGTHHLCVALPDEEGDLW